MESKTVTGALMLHRKQLTIYLRINRIFKFLMKMVIKMSVRLTIQ